jgi:hypothetical protein
MPTVFLERVSGSSSIQMKGRHASRCTLDNMEAKFWLNPVVHVAYNDGYDARTLRQLTAMVEANRDRIERAWDEFFG